MAGAGTELSGVRKPDTLVSHGEFGSKRAWITHDEQIGDFERKKKKAKALFPISGNLSAKKACPQTM